MNDGPGLIPSWRGTPVRDPLGTWLGVVDEVLFDDRSPQPRGFVVRAADAVRVVPAGSATVRAAHVEISVAG